MKKHEYTPDERLLLPRVKPLRALFFILMAFILVAADQLSKQWVLGNKDLRSDGEISLIPNWFSLRYTFNRGAAWSFLADYSWGIYLLIGVSAVASLFFIIILVRRSGWPFFLPFSIALLLAGTVGNLIDRVYLQGVVDFFNFYHGNWHFPTFNVADSLIVVGVILLLVYLLFFEEKDKQRLINEQKNRVRPL